MNNIRHLALIARRQARPSSSVSSRCWRAFSVTPRLHATEQDDTFLNNFQKTSLFQKLADKPEALLALRDFATLLKNKGIEGPPSTTQMMRIAASSDCRQAMQRVVDELQKAGIDLRSPDALRELAALSKNSGS
ncbi:hypothetical protein F5I97DRAFT_917852 [Phlebopus sp. FC_14]|nr:hypothetical protein F5I97DRAFT_917852 [Phlebopus sp. FC_14]